METTTRNIWVAALVLLALPSALAYASTKGIGYSGYTCTGDCGNLTEKDYIIAGGEATVTVDASIMIAHLDFVGRGATAREAYDAQAAVMERVEKMLRDKGVTELQTTDFAIEPIYKEDVYDGTAHSDWEGIENYKVSNTLIIKVRDAKLFESVLVEAMDLGVNQITDMRFIPDAAKIKEAKRRVRELALADAKDNAAWQSGILGRPLSSIAFVGDPSNDIVSRSSYDWYGQGQIYNNIAAQTSYYLTSGDVVEVEDSLSPGSVTFRSSVSIGYLFEGG
jgi:uncharacterized protein YggE